MKFDALVGRRHGQAGLRYRQYRLTDLTALAGAVVWLALGGLRAVRSLPLSVVELHISVAVLVLVPLGLGLAATPRESGGQLRLYALVVLAQLPAALAAVLGFSQPAGSLLRVTLLLPWLGLTWSVGLVGLWRLLSHGLTPIHELSVDAALLYLPVAGIFLVFHAADVTFHFSSLIVLLTGVHFHYAGFVLPLVVGLIGRHLGPSGGTGFDRLGLVDRLLVAGTAGVIVGISLIAVAITASSTLELPAVLLFTVSVVLVVAATLARVRTVPLAPRLLLVVASGSILVTTGLAVAYAVTVFPGIGSLLAIPEMIRWHGTINVFGFSLPALGAFRLLPAE